MKIFTDGACNGNPGGPMGIGVAFINDAGEVIHAISEAIGNGTNNIAEATAVIRALETSIAHRLRAPEIFTDSQLIVYQILGKYACNNEGLIPLVARGRRLLADARATIAWIPRERNEIADRLSKRAIAPTVVSDPLRVEIRRLLETPTLLAPPIPPTTEAVLRKVLEEDDVAVTDALLDLQPGRDAFSAIRGNALRITAVARHGTTAIAAMEQTLHERSAKTNTNAMRWASRGLPPTLAIAKVNLDKAIRAPFTNRGLIPQSTNSKQP